MSAGFPRVALDARHWQTLGELSAPRREALGGVRVVAHWGAQLVAAVGGTHGTAAEDFSHTNLGWERELGALCSRAVGRARVRVGLRLRDLHLLLVGPDGDVRAQCTLEGTTLESALRWLEAALLEADAGLLCALTLPAHDMPPHPVGPCEGGARFPPLAERAAGSLETLVSVFDNGQQLARAVAELDPRASEVRCWPHHFDIATLIQLDEGRTIGVGMSPGDGSYAHPYFYVTPWPYPADTRALPRLPSGHWHTEGWVGAVLAAADGASAQAAEAFVNTAIGSLHP